jgi:hypothetical protein
MAISEQVQPERCPICWSVSNHARHCTRGDTPEYADAMAYKLELSLAMGTRNEVSGPALLALVQLLDAVKVGATLVLTGPDPQGPKGSPRFGASIEATTGDRHADAYGETAAVVFQHLLQQWNAGKV